MDGPWRGAHTWSGPGSAALSTPARDSTVSSWWRRQHRRKGPSCASLHPPFRSSVRQEGVEHNMDPQIRRRKKSAKNANFSKIENKKTSKNAFASPLPACGQCLCCGRCPQRVVSPSKLQKTIKDDDVLFAAVSLSAMAPVGVPRPMGRSIGRDLFAAHRPRRPRPPPAADLRKGERAPPGFMLCAALPH